LEGAIRGLRDRKQGKVGIGGKIKWRLSEVNTRTVSRGQDKLIGKFKMVAGDVISIRGQVPEYTYILTGIGEIWYEWRLEG
jgi:hypothetical protein